MDRVAWFMDPSLCGIVAVGAASLFYLSNKRKAAGAIEPAPSTKRIACSDDAKVDSKQYSVGDPHPYTLKPEFKGCVYMDYNATTPVFPEVTAVMLPFLTTCFGNPSSSHIFSTPCRDALKLARNQVGALVNAKDPMNEIYFTSCGTESDNRAIDIAIHHFTQYKKKRGIDMNNIIPHIISCKTEHPAVICYLRILVLEQKIHMTVLPVNSEGFINIADLKKALTPNTALVTIMHSNNEVGTIQPIREITQCVKQYNSQLQGDACVLVHTDAAQSLGKVLVDVQHLETDLVTIVGHKYGAPKGVAALYMRTGVQAPQMLVGGGQERGIRSGTENVALVAGLGEASRLALAESGSMLLHLLSLKHRLVSALLQGFAAEKSKLSFNGAARACSPKDLLSELKIIRVMIKSDSKNNLSGGSAHTALRGAMTLDVLQQLPNTVSVSFQGIRSYEIIAALSEKVACSAGSACHAVHTAENSSNTEGNHPVEVKMSDVLAAMGVPEDFGFGTLRLSFGRHTTEKDIDTAVEHIITAIKTAWKK